jgi:hypothetical protein
MYRVLWTCRNCQHTWWTEGKSLFDAIDTTGRNGCPKQCAGLTGQVFLKEYETVGTRPRAATTIVLPARTSPFFS